MLPKKLLTLTIVTLALVSSPVIAKASQDKVGVVNFSTCLTDSKLGKYEQEQLENIRKQWSSLMEETEKELKSIRDKKSDQEFLDGLSPEAVQELNLKEATLNDDLAKYQGQLYQVMNQAQYFFIQKVATAISKASEKVATQKQFDVILNKEACFYNKPNLDLTTLVIAELDKDFEETKKATEAKQEPKQENKQENIKAQEAKAEKK